MGNRDDLKDTIRVPVKNLAKEITSDIIYMIARMSTKRAVKELKGRLREESMRRLERKLRDLSEEKLVRQLSDSIKQVTQETTKDGIVRVDFVRGIERGFEKGFSRSLSNLAKGLLSLKTLAISSIVVVVIAGGVWGISRLWPQPVAPAAPTRLMAEAPSSDRVDLLWRDNANSETEFRIERSVNNGFTFSVIVTLPANANTFTDTTVAADTTYVYRVFAVSDAGNSSPSNEAQVVTPLEAPSAPTRLAATASSADRVDLTWWDNANSEAEYRLERSANNGLTFSIIATLPANTTAFNDTSVAADTTYVYRVFAINDAGDSSPSNEALVVTPLVISPPPPVPLPLAPWGLLAQAPSPGGVDLSWTDNSNNETEFRIERSVNNGFTFSAIAILPANTTTFRDTAVNSATAYVYRVFAVNNAGDSAPSKEARVTTPSATPSAPTILVAAASTRAGPTVIVQVDLSWTDNSNNETEFRIERSVNNGFTFAVIATLPANTITYSDTTVTADTAYVYRVFATNDAGGSLPSNEARITP
jgi:fibronectin type 3 domain-containing protein